MLIAVSIYRHEIGLPYAFPLEIQEMSQLDLLLIFKKHIRSFYSIKVWQANKETQFQTDFPLKSNQILQIITSTGVC